MKTSLKIAIFSGAIPSTTFIEHLIDGVAKHHQVLLFGVIEKEKHYESKNIRVYKTPYSHILNLCYTVWRLLKLGFTRPKDVIKLFKEISKYNRLYDKWIWFSKFLPIILYRPDIFHMQWTRDLEFYTFLKTRFDIPMVVSLRGAHMHYTPIVLPYIADVYRAIFPAIDRFHAVSESMSQAAQHFGAQKKQIQVIHSPISKSVLGQYLTYKKNATSFRIGFVGRFHWVKGVRYAFEACTILNSQKFDYNFTVVSSNTPTEEVLFKLNQLQLQNSVNIKSELSQEKLFEVMKSFDVLLLPSLNEGIANVVLEAMAMGIPVISTDCGGMSEVVINNTTGWLVPIRDPKAIAKAIVEVSETSEQEIQRITQNAHNFVKKHFNADNSIKKFLELYEDVISQGLNDS